MFKTTVVLHETMKGANMNKIAFWRREKFITQEELSYMTAISRARLGLIERHFIKPTENELRSISKSLDVSTSKLTQRNSKA